MTGQEVFNLVMDLADERDTNGTINASNTADYSVRTPGLLTLIQSQLIELSRYTKTHTISRQKPIIGLGSFEVLMHSTEDVTAECDLAYGYTLASTGTGTVIIEDYNGTWNTLETLSVSADTTYSGSLTPTAGATKSRFRLTGDYAFGIYDYALYTAKLPTYPAYAPRVVESMPSDFASTSDIVTEEWGYTTNKPYMWENDNQLMVDVNFGGQIRVVYYPNPTAITALTDNMTLNDRLCRTTVAYFLGMELYKEENDILYAHFKTMYENSMTMFDKPRRSTNSTIYDEYGGF